MFLFSIMSTLALFLSQAVIQLVLGSVSLGVKWQGHEADLSPPSSTESETGGAMPPLPIAPHGMALN
jgi:hypothetical protein